ncbi:MAG: bifunctional riboflavin kinase/FAD synthetase [Gammaproteobacteria bacterium]|nr:bifunctional riboflavin kinase/FAD synthetase [Gammaproteobacteria bacterium]
MTASGGMEGRAARSAPPALIPRFEGGSVVTVGTFDGVHLGHREVLREMGRRARHTGRPSVLVTFRPHPLQVLRPKDAPGLLTSSIEKKEILAQSDLDYAVFLPFTRALARYTPRRFVEEILVARMRVRELVIGYDHGFGRGRSGDAETLDAMGAELGFDVQVVPPIVAGGGPVSSSRIRRALLEGDVRAAHTGLGRPYSLRGVVVRGDGRGRRLGFPTANLEIRDSRKLIPGESIYAVRAGLPGGTWDGALHIGPRPTFPGARASIEVHLLDYSADLRGADLYGAEIRLDLIERLREVRSFASVAELVDEMSEDVRRARRILAEYRDRHSFPPTRSRMTP